MFNDSEVETEHCSDLSYYHSQHIPFSVSAHPCESDQPSSSSASFSDLEPICQEDKEEVVETELRSSSST